MHVATGFRPPLTKNRLSMILGNVFQTLPMTNQLAAILILVHAASLRLSSSRITGRRSPKRS